MDDNDTICPLCCEELDMSDRQFFPCKCGYQVCMWCWHRIREQETGLCPACRTPYGDDPHEFSAVDMQEVLKANKEKAAAEKRERERMRQLSSGGGGGGNTTLLMGEGGMLGGGSMNLMDGEGIGNVLLTFRGGGGTQDLPKDRNALANMRVIRRNLVYAVGFPLSIATEEVLKKPEYLGQYGKIGKIVLNRNHTVGTDTRRASASAYITFVHKEDALACIIALDGFYLDGRNIRASYGTSKYCSAFIKNLKCSNPDCTYLHSMGEAEDTFSKQEIQAGYVTSGRDVLARQQQMAAAIASSTSRKKVGGGGPSGTGRIAPNPIFPPPTYEEPHRSTQMTTHIKPLTTSQFPPVSQPSLSRSNSGITTAGFSTVAANGPLPDALRSQSLSAVESIQTNDFDDDDILECDEVNNPTFTSNENYSSSHPQGIAFKGDVSIPSNDLLAERRNSLPSNAVSLSASNAPTTAASIVAGTHTASKSVPPSSLSTLTPLKRASSMTSASSSVAALGLTKSSGSASTYNANVQDISILSGSNSDLLRSTVSLSEDDSYIRSNTFRNGITVSPSSSISSNGQATLDSSKILHFHEPEVDTSIGGSVIGSMGPTTFPLFPPPSSNSSGNYVVPRPTTGLNEFMGAVPPTSSAIASNHSNLSTNNYGAGETRFHSSSSSSYLGTSSFDSEINPEMGKSLGTLVGNNDLISPGMAFNHSGRDNTMFMRNLIPSAIGPPPQQNRNSNSGVIGGGRTLIGGTTIMGPAQSSGLTSGNFLNLGQSSSSGSSILASMLGIELPTGSGSLRDSLWDPSPSQIAPSLSSKSSHQPPPPIGSGVKSGGDVILGRGSSVTNPHLSSSVVGGNRNSNDIALLQSLLPGVHITSGNVYQPATNIPSVSSGNNTHASHLTSTSWLSSGNNNTSILMDRPMTGNANPAGLSMHPQYGQPLQQTLQPQPQNKYEQWGNMYASGSGTLNPSNNNNLPMAPPQPNLQQFPQQGQLPNIW